MPTAGRRNGWQEICNSRLSTMLEKTGAQSHYRRQQKPDKARETALELASDEASRQKRAYGTLRYDGTGRPTGRISRPVTKSTGAAELLLAARGLNPKATSCPAGRKFAERRNAGNGATLPRPGSTGRRGRTSDQGHMEHHDAEQAPDSPTWRPG